MEIRELGEFGLIDRLQKKLPPLSSQTLTGIGDDAAVFRPAPGCDLVLSTDMLVEDVHFAKHTMSYPDIGWKALAASISDIAAMGAIPKQAVVSIAIPPHIQVEDMDELYDGIAQIAAEYSVDVAGGDTVKTGDKLVLSVTLTGEVPAGRSVLRSGARPGDLVFITGTVGGSAAGLHLLSSSARLPLPPDEQIRLQLMHRRPKPQVAVGNWLSGSAVCHALNDISDGVASEAHEIAKASQVAIELEAQRIPIAAEVRNYCRFSGLDPLELALFGGEDYQLIGCLDPLSFGPAVEACRARGVGLHQVGRVIAAGSPEVFLTLDSGEKKRLPARGYNHFGG